MISAQERTDVDSERSALSVTAFASADRVRFAAPSSVVQIRLELFNSAGRKLFDNEVRGGNVLDWHLQDGQTEPFPDGAYLCVVTVKSLSGKLTQRIGTLIVEKNNASLLETTPSQMTRQQVETTGPIENGAALTLLKEDGRQTTTVVAHNGEDGQIVRGRGALSFRIGDFFRGTDTEQMRLTAEGNLGIGITHPEVRLDVDGLIRASKGIVFPDGTIQTTAAVANSNSRPSANEKSGISLGNLQSSENQSGGTVKKHKKGEKSPELFVNEDLTVNGNIIFTSPLPGAFQRDITVQDNNGGLRFFGAPALTTTPAAAAIQFWGTASPFHGQLYLDSGADDQSAVIIRSTGTGGTITERMRVTATGNVGIGTTNPAGLLHVRGVNPVRILGDTTTLAGSESVDFFARTSVFNSDLGGMRIQRQANTGDIDTIIFAAASGGAALERMRISGNGNVGIGTTSPDRPLTVRRNGGAYINMRDINFSDGPHELLVGADINGGIISTMTNEDLQLRAGLNSIKMIIKANGNVGIGTINPSTRLDVTGVVTTQVLQITGGVDLSERFDVSSGQVAAGSAPEQIRPGNVVSIDPKQPGRLELSKRAYDIRVAGIISGAGGVSPGVLLNQAGLVGEGAQPVALTGRVYCWADASNGPIRPGDLLTTSKTPGHAMKVRNHAMAKGAIIGKAMSGLRVGRGLVLVLVSLQ